MTSQTDPMLPHAPGNAGLPIGSITAFAGHLGNSEEFNTQGFGIPNIESQGWMVCDGRELSCVNYQKLFAMLGFLYNQRGDAYQPGDSDPRSDSATFRIPDYRGYFLRMTDGGQNVDPDAQDRRLSNGQTGNSIGSIQTDALADHQHTFTSMTQGGEPAQVGPGIPTYIQNPAGNPTSSPINQQGTVKTSTENRPKNMAVYYLIKFI